MIFSEVLADLDAMFNNKNQLKNDMRILKLTLIF